MKLWSIKCNYTQYWDKKENKCLRCEVTFVKKKGLQFSPNCGRSDDGSQHVSPYKRCPSGTFNNGSFVSCQNCSSTCGKGRLLSQCNATSDRICTDETSTTAANTPSTVTPSTTKFNTESPVTTSVNSLTPSTKASGTGNEYDTTLKPKSTFSYTTFCYRCPTETSVPRVTVQNSTDHHVNAWTVFGVVSFTFLLTVALYLLLYIIRKKKSGGCRDMQRRVRKISLKAHEPFEHAKEESVEELRTLLSADIQTAPLQTVLNNLDLVEELIVLLDPESPGMKNTRHLAATCSLPFAWINYTYSMKASKSPLIAVLEKVITKHPHWTVNHLVNLLSKIGRNDAIAVLAKLNVTAEEV